MSFGYRGSTEGRRTGVYGIEYNEESWVGRHYLSVVCGFTTLGLLISAVTSRISLNWEISTWPRLLALLGGTIIAAFLGIFMFLKSDNPVISFMGTTLLTSAFGLMLGPVLATYTSIAIFKAFGLLVVMSVVLGAVGLIVPRSLESWGSYLFGGLVVLLIGLFAVPIAGAFGLDIGGALTILDWVGVLVFSGFVIYDLNQAKYEDHTLDKAIDRSGIIYLDLINLFQYLLALVKD